MKRLIILALFLGACSGPCSDTIDACNRACASNGGVERVTDKECVCVGKREVK